jgi:hypothetical protein
MHISVHLCLDKGNPETKIAFIFYILYDKNSHDSNAMILARSSLVSQVRKRLRLIRSAVRLPPLRSYACVHTRRRTSSDRFFHLRNRLCSFTCVRNTCARGRDSHLRIDSRVRSSNLFLLSTGRCLPSDRVLPNIRNKNKSTA